MKKQSVIKNKDPLVTVFEGGSGAQHYQCRKQEGKHVHCCKLIKRMAKEYGLAVFTVQ